MKLKCAAKEKWLVRLTLVLIFFSFMENYGVSSVSFCNHSVFIPSGKKNFLDTNSRNSGWKTSDWEKMTNMNYDNFACIQLYKIDKFPGVPTSSKNNSSASKVYLNTTDFNFELVKCLNAAKYLRSTCQTIDTIKSLKELPTPRIDLEEVVEFKNYSCMTVDDLDILAEGYLSNYICFLRLHHKETLTYQCTNCRFETKFNCLKQEGFYIEQFSGFLLGFIASVLEWTLIVFYFIFAAGALLSIPFIIRAAKALIWTKLSRNEHDTTDDTEDDFEDDNGDDFEDDFEDDNEDYSEDDTEDDSENDECLMEYTCDIFYD